MFGFGRVNILMICVHPCPKSGNFVTFKFRNISFQLERHVSHFTIEIQIMTVLDRAPPPKWRIGRRINGVYFKKPFTDSEFWIQRLMINVQSKLLIREV